MGRTRHGGGEGEVAFYQLGGAILALWGRENLANDARLDLAPATPGKSFGGLALAYNTRDEAEVDSVLEQAAAAGATVLQQAQKTDGRASPGYFPHPDGHNRHAAHKPFRTPGAAGSVSQTPQK